MVIASAVSASHSTDPVAQAVRGFIAPSARLATRAQAEPATPGAFDLVRLYPTIFSAAPEPAFSVRSARATSMFASAAAAALAIVVGVLNHS